MTSANSYFNKSLNKYIKAQDKISGVMAYRHSQSFDKLIFHNTNNKQTKICIYMISKVNPKTNIYKFTIKDIANQFGTSKATVQRALNKLRTINKYLEVTNTQIKYRNYHPYRKFEQKRGYIK